MDYYALATIVAIICGPIFAVLTTRVIDNIHSKKQRRVEIFRILMSTRRLVLSAQHVQALNLVEIEFRNERSVLNAFANYLQHLSKPRSATETSAETERWIGEKDRLLAKLLHSIGGALGYSYEQFEIFEGGYTPQGWAEDEYQMKAIKYYLLEILQNNRAVPITQFVKPSGTNLFPPPPTYDQE